MCINTKDWNSWIDTMPGSEPTLIVTGEVETNAGNMLPVLREKVPQGPNQIILMLDLTIEKSGQVGTDDVAFRDARFEKPAKEGGYTSVEIYFKNSIIAAIPVDIVS